MTAAVDNIRRTFTSFPPTEAEDEPQSLIVSPYTSQPHLLDLSNYEKSSQLFAKAFTIFQPTRSDYATAEYVSAFNFPQVFNLLKQLVKTKNYTWRKREFYVVSFRSQVVHDVDVDRLFQLDAFSHQEAMASGGLLKYWYGVKDDERRNLATCFWESREHAREGGKGPWHAKARAAARIWYESIVFKTYLLTIEDDVGGWSIRDLEAERQE